MSLIDISTNSAHYVYRKSIGTVKDKISILILGFKGLIDRLPWSFQLLTWTSERKSVNTARKNGLKLLKMQILNVVCWIAPQSRGILQTFLWSGASLRLPSHNTNVCKISWLCGAILSPAFNESPLNFVISLKFPFPGFCLMPRNWKKKTFVPTVFQISTWKVLLLSLSKICLLWKNWLIPVKRWKPVWIRAWLQRNPALRPPRYNDHTLSTQT